VTHGTSTQPSSSGLSPYRAAIDLTADAIVRRGRLFRNLVIVVVLIGLVSVVWAAVARSATALCGVLLILPSCGVFFCLDMMAVNAWRHRILEAWSRREVDLSAFRSAIRASPAFPRDTTESMLAMLPPTPELVAEQRISSATRGAIAAEAELRNNLEALRRLAAAATSGLVTGGAIAVLATHRWVPLACLTLLLLRPPLVLLAQRRQHRRGNAALAAFRASAGFSEADFAQALALPAT